MILSPFFRAVQNPLDWETEIIWNPLDPYAELTVVRSEILEIIRTCPDSISLEMAQLLLDRRLLFKSKIHAWADARQVLNARPSDTGRIVVMPTAGCQFACNQSEYGAYCGQQHTSQKLQIDRISAIVSRALTIVKSRNLKRFELGFFGGEPLLNEEFLLTALSRVGDALREVNPQIVFEGSIVTNGFRLTASRFDVLWQAGMRRYEVTIDGIEDVHNTRRPLKGGLGTFSTIHRNLVGIAEQLRKFRHGRCTQTDETDGSVRIRCNVDNRNVGSLSKLLEFLEESQLVPPFSFYVAPIRDWGRSKARTEFSSRQVFASAETDVFRWMLDRGFVPALLPKRANETCIAMTSTPSVLAPDGEWYACTETPLGIPKTKSKTSRHHWVDLSIADWKSAVSTAQTPCSTCTFLPVCGGACPKEWLEGGTPCPPYVENWKSRIHIEVLRRGIDNLPKISINK